MSDRPDAAVREQTAVRQHRLFIDIHLRQWSPGVHVVRLRDAHGNSVELDGLIHDRPHQFILLELTPAVDDNGIVAFEVPGVFADYHPHNGRELGAQAPEITLPDGTVVPAGEVKPVPPPARKVERHPVHGIVWKHSGLPVHPAPTTPEGKPAERGANTPHIAAAPLGVHKEVKPRE